VPGQHGLQRGDRGGCLRYATERGDLGLVGRLLVRVGLDRQPHDDPLGGRRIADAVLERRPDLGPLRLALERGVGPGVLRGVAGRGSPAAGAQRVLVTQHGLGEAADDAVWAQVVGPLERPDCLIGQRAPKRPSDRAAAPLRDR